MVLTLDDDALDRLADLVVERLRPSLATSATTDRWLTSREAAHYLGLPSVAQLHKLTAARVIPFVQDRPGGRCYFKATELDRWRGG